MTIIIDSTTEGLVAKALTAQDQADLAAEELRKEDNPGNVYDDWNEMMDAVSEAREGGDSEIQFVFRPGAPVTIPPGKHDLTNVILDGSGGGREISFADGATVNNLTAIKDANLVALGAPPLRFDKSFHVLPRVTKKQKKTRNHPVDGKKRGKRRRDFGAAGKGFNAKGNR